MIESELSPFERGLQGLIDGQLRPLLAPRVYTLPLVRSIGKTMVQGKNYGPQITVKRIATRGKKCRPVFAQVSQQVVKLKPEDLCLPARAWKVTLLGEGADDAGGVFDDTITEMCMELESGVIPLLLPTPNSRTEAGNNRDRYVLNPSMRSAEELSMLKFLGILLGVAIRTKKPLDLHLAPCVWKLLAGMPLGIDDIEEVDFMYVQSLRGILDIDKSGVNETNFHEFIPLDCFEGQSLDGRMVAVIPGGRSIPLNFHNRQEYVDSVLQYKMKEMDQQAAMVREGMSWIVPVPLLSLLTAKSLEQLVCGMEHIDVDLLQKVVRYRGIDEHNKMVVWFWKVLHSFSNEERIQFLRFVSGRTRLPANPADISQRFQIISSGRGEDSLPTSQTCFFQLRLPTYSNIDTLAEKLRYAINHCKSIDMDNYMLRTEDGDGAATFDNIWAEGANEENS